MAARTASYARRPGASGGIELRIRSAVIFILLMLGVSGQAMAATVHKWVDADGVTHYSDQAPPEAAAEISQVSLNETTTSGPKKQAVEDNYYSIANQWQRMQREGELRRQYELQRQKIRVEQQKVAERSRVPDRAEDDDRRYIGIYGYHKKRRHGHYPTIKHPPVRPSRGSGLGAFPSIP